MAPIPPQQRRYLRNAPRPDTWPDLCGTVLHQLGDQAETTIHETLALLRENNPQPPRSGPGRKSNAEHAINFYEYLLEQLPTYQRTEERHDETTSPSTTDPQQEEEEEEDEEEEEEEDAEDDEQYSEEEEDALVDESMMDTETFNAKHNTLCQVCDGGGDVLQCSTCNLVFHLDCVRPGPLEQWPSVPYICSYCIMTQGLPVNSKPRRQAAAAVRLMARLRKRKTKERRDRGDFNEKELEERRLLGLDETTTTTIDTSAVGPGAVTAGTKPDDAVEVDQEAIEMETEEEDRKPAAKPKSEVIVREQDEPSENEQESNDENEGSDEEEEQASNEEQLDTTLEEEEDEVSGDEQDEDDDNDDASGGSDGEDDDDEEEEGSDDGASEAEKIPSSESKEESDASLSAEHGEPTGPSDNKEEAQDAPGAKKPAPVDETDNNGETKEEGGESGRHSPRRRKHPTIYNPQVVPASRWQTDELQEWKMSRDDDAAKKPASSRRALEADTKDPTLVSARKVALQDEDAIWCNFCKDNPEIQICVFCACRVCFGKHEGKKLLICDQCDEEYHTFCLDPPLASVPDSQQWFCPTCASQPAAEKSDGRSRARDRSRARKSGTKTPKRSSRVSSSEKDKRKKKAKPGRPRGRPPKNKEVVATVPRKRGRPFKNPQSAESDRPRKRGRPPKSDSTRSKSEPPRKRGRPPSAATLAKRAKAEADARKAERAAAAAEAAKSASKRGGSKRSGEHLSEETVRLALAAAAAANARPDSPPIKSRSGRTVKRSTFHDELGHGMQQLQTSKLLELVTVNPGEQSLVIPGSTEIPGAARSRMASTGSLRSVASATSSLKAPPATLNTNNFPGLQSAAANANLMPSMVAGGAVNRSAAAASLPSSVISYSSRVDHSKQPRRKPGARECMQISRRFGVKEIPERYIEVLTDYCNRGKLEHLIRMRERLDEHSRFLEAQLAGLEALVNEKGESNVVVPLAPPSPSRGE